MEIVLGSDRKFCPGLRAVLGGFFSGLLHVSGVRLGQGCAFLTNRAALSVALQMVSTGVPDQARRRTRRLRIWSLGLRVYLEFRV